MNIHIVQPGETIDSIAQKYRVPVIQLIQDNELITPKKLIAGQNIIIIYPEQIYTVKKGDSLIAIAEAHGVTLIQLLRNNPHLSINSVLYPGEIIVISYNKDQEKISVDGYTYPFIDKKTLRKTLPFLTYLTIFNYQILENAEIVSMGDDLEIIQMAKDYGVAPIMLLSTLTTFGVGGIVKKSVVI